MSAEVLQSERLPDAALRVGRRIARLAGDESDEAVLAVSLALSALGNGSVLVDLTDPEAALPPVEGDAPDLLWPDPEDWRHTLQASPVTGGGQAPLCLDGHRVYLQRYRQAEQRIADNLLGRIGGVPGAPAGVRDAALDQMQQEAVATVLANRLTVLTGGPGTGKTYTIARILRAFDAPGRGAASVALAAPTGKAAARMKEAIAEEQRAAGSAPAGRMEAATLHRLLQSVPGDVTTFRRNGRNPLPHDVVIVDETSMIDVAMLDALLAAVRPDSRLILVGDADQLASVAAGNALADLVRSGVIPTVRLQRNYRNDGGIPELAQAIRTGDVAAVEDLLSSRADLHWGEEATHPPEIVREWITGWGSALRHAAGAGHVTDALTALEQVRVLCAHRRGPYGVGAWTRHVVADFRPGRGEWPAGQPMMVTRNRVVPDLFNGDTGVIVEVRGEVRVAFAEDMQVAPERLGSEAVPAYALTTHKAQGSQFDRVVIVLPEPRSRILTRELLYTAVTRARSEVAILGSRESLRAALGRRISRASGLTDRLRAGSPPPGVPIPDPASGAAPP